MVDKKLLQCVCGLYSPLFSRGKHKLNSTKHLFFLVIAFLFNTILKVFPSSASRLGKYTSAIGLEECDDLGHPLDSLSLSLSLYLRRGKKEDGNRVAGDDAPGRSKRHLIYNIFLQSLTFSAIAWWIVELQGLQQPDRILYIYRLQPARMLRKRTKAI